MTLDFESQANVFAAKDLRCIGRERDFFWNFPGWYRWWAPVDLCRRLLDPHADALLPHLTKGNGFLAGHNLIYVGITKEPLYSRVIAWHICEKHKLGKIKHRTLSTFRQSIASLTSGTWANEATTNTAIDKMKVEIFPVDLPVGTQETKQAIEVFEAEQLARHLVPINIRDNHDDRLAEFHRMLSKKRSEGRKTGLLEFANMESIGR